MSILRSSEPLQADQQAALRACETEPIRTPGQVQPHGALMLCAPSGELLGASESVTGLLGFMPIGRLGQPLADLLGKPFWILLQRNAGILDAQNCGPVRFVWEHPFGKTFDCWVSWSAAGWIVDFERRHFQKAEGALLASARTLQILAAGERLVYEPDIAQHFADAARRLLGFDHVMVYRFHEDWHGEVIAESTEGTWDRWLGVHWPATDIPAQARALYLVAPVRQIPDVDARPAPLRLWRGVDQPDLGLSILRSTSPYHLQYMRNMGVKASLVGSLIDDGRLWGLVACHNHHSALYTCAEEREAFAWLCRELMLRLARRREAARAAWTEALAAQRARALEPGHHNESGSVASHGSAVMGLAAADGVAWIEEGRVESVGLAPPGAALLEFARLWGPAPSETLRSTSNLGQLAAAAAGPLRDAAQALLAAGVAGIALADAVHQPGRTIAWLRHEWRRDIRWGGNPNQPVDVDSDGRAWPRSSFAAWLESVRGSSRAWEQAELDSIESFAAESFRRARGLDGFALPANVEPATPQAGSPLARAVFEHALQMRYRVMQETAKPQRVLGYAGWPFIRVQGQAWRPLSAHDWTQLDLDARAALQQWILAQARVDQGQLVASGLASARASLSVPAWIGSLSKQRWQAVFERWLAAESSSTAVTLALDVQDALTPELDFAAKQHWAAMAQVFGAELRAWGLGSPAVDLPAVGASKLWHSLWWVASPTAHPSEASEASEERDANLWAALLSASRLPRGRVVGSGDVPPPPDCTFEITLGNVGLLVPWRPPDEPNEPHHPSTGS